MNKFLYIKSIDMISKYLISIIMTVSSFFVAVHCYRNEPSGIYIYIYMIPLAYGILNLVFIKVYGNIRLCSMIVLAFMYFRYVLTILAIEIDGFPRGVYFIQSSSEISSYSTLLMIYEMFIIFLSLSIIKNKSVKVNKDYAMKVLNRMNFYKLNGIILSLIIFTLTIYLIYPSLFSNYSFILGGDLEGLVESSVVAQGDLPTGMRWIGYTMGESVRYVLIEYSILNLYKKNLNTSKMRYCFFSIIIILLNASLTTSRQLVGIFLSIAFFYQIYILYPKYRRLFFKLVISFGMIFMIVFTSVYWSNSLKYQSLSQMMQGYANGFYNIYQSNFAYKEVDLDFFQKIYMLIFGDSIGSVNVLSSFINTINSAKIYNSYIYQSSFSGGAIVPLLSQMSYNFGFLVGPWVSFVFIYLSNSFGNKICNKGNSIVNMFLTIMFAITPFIYNWSIFLHVVTVTIAPIWILSKLNSLKLVKNK